MISWIQNHLIRHGRWIFLTLLAVIIVAFVFTIGNTPGFAPRTGGFEAEYFYGVNLNAPREFEPLTERASFSQFLRTGMPIRSNEQLEQALLSRIAMLHLADELGIPSPTEAQLSAFIRTRPAFFGENGSFSRDRYLAFVDDMETNPTGGTDMLFRVLDEDFRMDRVFEAIAGPGFALKAEALATAINDGTEVEVIVASARLSRFRPEIEVTDERLEQFYRSNAERYREPSRIDASLVRFVVDPSSVQISSGDARAHFAANRSRFVAAFLAENPVEQNTSLDDNGESAAENPTMEVSFEDVERAVIRELRRERANRLSNEKAHRFAFTLYDRSISKNSPAFNELVAEMGVEPVAVEPFSADEVGARDLPRQLLESAFTLTPNRYYTSAVRLDNGFGVLLFNQRIESYIPEFAEVRRDVEADYRAEERRRLFVEHGRALREQMQLALESDADADFAAIVRDLELTVDPYTAFTLGNPPRELGESIINQLSTLGLGEVGPMVIADGVGRFAFVVERSVPSIEMDDERFTSTLDMLNRFSVFAAAQSLLGELIEKGSQARAR